jgi:threonine dehydratase
MSETSGGPERSRSRSPLRLPHATGIERARAVLRPYLPETPLVRSELLSRALDAEVWLKNETVSPIASFKLRGALTALLRASETRGAVEAVTSSTGNHGQGVAYAARAMGIAAHVFLPVGANPVKRRMIAALGATIHEGGADLDEAKDDAQRFC